MNLSVKKTTNHHIFRAGMLGFFISYIAVMLCLLFWERAFNNASILYPQKEKVSYLNSIRTHIILTPMHSIKHFSEEILKYDVKTILREFSDFHFAFYNLFGNIVFFMPMGIFIPYFFKRYQNLFRFAILMLFLAFSIESVQLLTLT